MSYPQVPEDSDTEHPVAGIDHTQARIGNDHKNSVLAGLGIVRMLIKMVSAEVQRMVHFDVLFSNDFLVFDDFQPAYVIANNSAIA